jgi:D-alanyl-D-alanine carboxypeptidase (penicillin-binding protein 5/6)
VFFELDGEVQLELPLVALETVEEGGMWSQFTDYISLQMDDLFD